MWPHQLFVNDQHQIKCVLFIYSTVCFKSNYQLLTKEEKSTKLCVTFFCDNKGDHFIIPLIQQHVPWSQTKEICFCSIQHRFSPIIETFINNNNNPGKCHSSSFHQMELDRTTFAEKSKTFSYSYPSGNYFILYQEKQLKCTILSDIIIRPLSVSDAAIINDQWTYKSIISLYQIIYEIEHFPAFGK